MSEYFAVRYTGAPFTLFGAAHLSTLIVMAVVAAVFLFAARRAEPSSRRAFGTGLAIFLAINETAWHVWNVSYGVWDIHHGLPLHLCSVMILVSAIALFTRRRSLYPVIYFLGIAGAAQALLTPDAGLYGFPHFRFFQTMFAHGGLVVAGLYVVLAERIRPTFRNAVQVMVGLNVYALVVYFVNSALATNYLYVNGKPDVPTLIDMMPAWPWYIPILEVLAALLIAALYAPFARSRTATSAAVESAPLESVPVEIGSQDDRRQDMLP